MKTVLIVAWAWVVFAYCMYAPSPQLTALQEAKAALKKTGERLAQSSLEVKPDEFSGATLVRLRDVPIVNEPDHVLTVTMETKVNDTSPAAQMASEEPRAAVVFTSFSSKGRDFGDREWHFLIDGKPLRIGVAAESPPFQNPDSQARVLRVGRRVHAVLRMADLRRIVAGREVRMRLGSLETSLSSNVMHGLRSFLNAADLAEAATGKEGAR